MRPPKSNSAALALAAAIVLLGPSASAADLTAGDVDDNLNFDHYVGYVQRARFADAALPGLGLEGRVTFIVTDFAGARLPHADVSVYAAGASAPLLTSRAGSDGLFRFFPDHDGAKGVDEVDVRVSAPGGTSEPSTRRVNLTALGEDRTVTVVAAHATAAAPATLDLAMVIDTTGSMADELQFITEELSNISAAVQAEHQAVEIRYGLVVYRDAGDVYVVRSFAFTSSLAQVQADLAAQAADNGGDYPEAMDEALKAAMQLDWSEGNAAKVMLLVADAPPHEDRFAETVAAMDSARREGVHIYPLAASGAGSQAEYLMRAGAVLTQGRYLFLTDDSGIGNAHDEPNIACFEVTALSGLVARVISSELSGARVEAPPAEVVRTVGNISGGVCLEGESAEPVQPTVPTAGGTGTAGTWDTGGDGASATFAGPDGVDTIDFGGREPPAARWELPGGTFIAPVPGGAAPADTSTPMAFGAIASSGVTGFLIGALLLAVALAGTASAVLWLERPRRP